MKKKAVKKLKKKASAKVKRAPTKKAKAKPRQIMNFKIDSKDRKALSVLAKKFAQGNLSAWLRHAGLRYQPKRGEKIEMPFNHPSRSKERQA